MPMTMMMTMMILDDNTQWAIPDYMACLAFMQNETKTLMLPLLSIINMSAQSLPNIGQNENMKSNQPLKISWDFGYSPSFLLGCLLFQCLVATDPSLNRTRSEVVSLC